jgi:hypothetical protein
MSKDAIVDIGDYEVNITKAQALIQKQTARIAELEAECARLREALRRFVAIDDADKSGKPLMSCQGQGMDGFSKLANYESATAKARAALKET